LTDSVHTPAHYSIGQDLFNDLGRQMTLTLTFYRCKP